MAQQNTYPLVSTEMLYGIVRDSPEGQRGVYHDDGCITTYADNRLDIYAPSTKVCIVYFSFESDYDKIQDSWLVHHSHVFSLD